MRHVLTSNIHIIDANLLVQLEEGRGSASDTMVMNEYVDLQKKEEEKEEARGAMMGMNWEGCYNDIDAITYKPKVVLGTPLPVKKDLEGIISKEERDEVVAPTHQSRLLPYGPPQPLVTQKERVSLPCTKAVMGLLGPQKQAICRSSSTVFGFAFGLLVNEEKIPVIGTVGVTPTPSASLATQRRRNPKPIPHPTKHHVAVPTTHHHDHTNPLTTMIEGNGSDLFNKAVTALNLQPSSCSTTPLAPKPSQINSPNHKCAPQPTHQSTFDGGRIDPNLQWAPASLTSAHLVDAHVVVNVEMLALRGRDQTVGYEIRQSPTSPHIKYLFVHILDDFCANLHARSVEFTKTTKVVTAGSGLLCGSSVVEVKYGALPRLQCVGNNWMSMCPRLTRISFTTECPRLRRIGDGWMRKCCSLPVVDLTAFRALEHVGGGWLSLCDSLVGVNFSMCQHLVSVGGSWLFGAVSLAAVSFTGMTALQCVGDSWLADCVRLKQASFNEMTSLRVVGGGWMARCSIVEFVSLCHLISLEYVGSGWIDGGNSSVHFHLGGGPYYDPFTQEELNHPLQERVEWISRFSRRRGAE